MSFRIQRGNYEQYRGFLVHEDEKLIAWLPFETGYSEDVQLARARDLMRMADATMPPMSLTRSCRQAVAYDIRDLRPAERVALFGDMAETYDQVTGLPLSAPPTGHKTPEINGTLLGRVGRDAAAFWRNEKVQDAALAVVSVALILGLFALMGGGK